MCVVIHRKGSNVFLAIERMCVRMNYACARKRVWEVVEKNVYTAIQQVFVYRLSWMVG